MTRWVASVVKVSIETLSAAGWGDAIPEKSIVNGMSPAILVGGELQNALFRTDTR